jgi:Homeodomain-like domain
MNDTDHEGPVDLSAVLATGDPAIGLRAVLALRRLAERVEAQQVALAREQGWSWQQIGDALGVTRQSIHTKHGSDRH